MTGLGDMELLRAYSDSRSEEALSRLGEKDRCAVLLHYFEGKSHREVAVALGTTEDGAQKRVSRALEIGGRP